MQHTAVPPAGISPLARVTLWVGEMQVTLSGKNTWYLPHSGDNFRLPGTAICLRDALWCSLVGDFLVQMLILTSEEVSHPFPSEFPSGAPQIEGSCAKNAF